MDLRDEALERHINKLILSSVFLNKILEPNSFIFVVHYNFVFDKISGYVIYKLMATKQGIRHTLKKILLWTLA